jgi:nucleoside-diphosphate-sugar epimerase
MGLKVLVTGANGFIGRQVVLELVSRSDVEVLGLQRSPSDKAFLKEVDYFNSDHMRRIFQEFKPDAVVHLASDTSRSRESKLLPRFLEANVSLSHCLLEAAAACSLNPKFVVFSTSEVYGPQEGILNESANLRPVSPYGVSKKMMEQLFEYYARLYGMHCDVFRLFNAYGIGQSEGYFLADLSKAFAVKQVFNMTKGEQQRDFVYIKDVVNAVVFSIRRTEGFNVYNLSTGNLVSLNEVVEKFETLIAPRPLQVRKDLPYRSNEIWRMGGDPSKLKQAGFQCAFDLDAGLKEMLV